MNFLTKLVALKPGKTVQQMIKNVMQGKDEGADNEEENAPASGKTSNGVFGKVKLSVHLLSIFTPTRIF